MQKTGVAAAFYISLLLKISVIDAIKSELHL